MELKHRDTRRDCSEPRLVESRTARGNIAVRHPARWRLLKDVLLSPSKRLHRYRTMSARLFEGAVDEYDLRNCHHE